MKVIESFNKPWRACIPMAEVKHYNSDCTCASKVVANQDKQYFRDTCPTVTVSWNSSFFQAPQM